LALKIQNIFFHLLFTCTFNSFFFYYHFLFLYYAPFITKYTNMSHHNNPLNIGILGLEVYTPRTFIQQKELETHMQVPAGKFTIGLGQEGLAVTGDVEDINSICLTVVHQLLEKYVCCIYMCVLLCLLLSKNTHLSFLSSHSTFLSLFQQIQLESHVDWTCRSRHGNLD
jgi:hypothetical protein